MGNAHFIAWALSAWLVASRVFRYVRLARKNSAAPMSQITAKAIAPQALMATSAALVLASICLGAPLFVTGAVLTSLKALGISMLCAAAIDVHASIRFPSIREPSGWRMVAPTHLAVFAAV